jgi:hypothetical protein
MAYILQQLSMENKKTDIKRNTPSEQGTNDDPNLRDYSGLQPGVSTISSSDTDEVNENVTRMASDNFREEEFGKDADKAFDEIEEDK